MTLSSILRTAVISQAVVICKAVVIPNCCQPPSRYQDSRPNGIYLRPLKDHPDFNFNGRSRPRLDSCCSSPLSHRSWTYQEIILSNRIFHYSNEELILESKTSIACQCGFTPLMPWTFSGDFNHKIKDPEVKHLS